MNKNAERDYNKKFRKMWGFSPTTRVVGSKKRTACKRLKEAEITEYKYGGNNVQLSSNGRKSSEIL